MNKHGAHKPPTERQWRVIELVAEGLSNREIAREMAIGSFVVKNYLTIVFRRVGVKNRGELAQWYTDGKKSLSVDEWRLSKDNAT